jgi:hypothetical protein
LWKHHVNLLLLSNTEGRGAWKAQARNIIKVIERVVVHGGQKYKEKRAKEKRGKIRAKRIFKILKKIPEQADSKNIVQGEIPTLYHFSNGSSPNGNGFSTMHATQYFLLLTV